jgi:type I restriction enzyme S subunit
MSWPVISLGEIANFRNGLNYSRENFGTGLKIISVANFGSRLVPDLASLDEINPEGVAKAEDYLCDGDILFVRSNGNRDLVGRAMLMKGIEDLAVGYSGFCIRARFTECDINPAFYAYLFRTPIIRHQLTAGGVGANIANVSQKTLARLAVPFPPKDEQDAIVAVLSMYDGLIATNQRRIALLEDTARLLYNEWFVHLHFPDYESEPLKDGMPLDWHRVPLSSLGEEVRDMVDPTAIPPETVYLSMEHMPQRSISFNTWDFAQKVVSTKLHFQIGDVLFGKIRPYFHKVGFTSIAGITSTDVIVVRAHETTLMPLVLMAMSSTDFIDYAVATSNGTKMPRANWKVLRQWPVLLPPRHILLQFHSLVSPMLDEMNTLVSQNRILAQTRDLLLPKLMSGQLDVSGISLPDEKAL